MPMSLSSLLQTYPYKKKDCLEHICAKFKITSNACTVDSLRQRILEFTDENSEMEEKIKEVAYHFKYTEEKKNKTSTPHSKFQSQSLFGDTDDDRDEAERMIDESFSLLCSGVENLPDDTTLPKTVITPFLNLGQL